MQSNPQIHGHWRLCWQRHCWSLLLLVPDRSHRPPDVLLAGDQGNATAPPLNIIMESKKDVDDYQHVFLEMLEPNFK